MRLTFVSGLLAIFAASPVLAGDDMATSIKASALSESVARGCNRSWDLHHPQFDEAVRSFDTRPRGLLILGSSYLSLGGALVGRIDGRPTAILVSNQTIVRSIDEATYARVSTRLDQARNETWESKAVHPQCAFVLRIDGALVPVNADAMDEGKSQLSEASRQLDAVFLSTD